MASLPLFTRAIPATSSVEHLLENMEAATGPLANEPQRARIIAGVRS